MLKILRKKAIAKVIFWGLVVLILPAFVLWGVGSFSGSKRKGPDYVGVIDKNKVSFKMLFGSMAAMRSQLILNYFNQPQILEAVINNKALLAKLAWDRLIMLNEARRYKINVPDKEVIDYIRSHPIFLRKDGFDSKLYEYILRYNMNLTPRTFEEITRENLKIHRLRDAVAKDISVTDDEILDEYRRENEKFKIAYILIEDKDFMDKVVVKESSVKEYYEGHKSEFVLPETDQDKEKDRIANFEDVKESIQTYLKESQARSLSLKLAEEIHKKMLGLAEEKGISFKEMAEQVGLRSDETPFFSKSEQIEKLGDPEQIIEAALKLKGKELSDPVIIRNGVIVFQVLESQGLDKERFEKEKGEFSKKALERKKERFLDSWFREIYLRSHLNINLADVESYL